MNIGIDDILFHDAEIHRVIEISIKDELAFEVMYPCGPDNNDYIPHTIVFSDVLNYGVMEGPFLGYPTILNVWDKGEEDGRVKVLIETNAGDRTLLCTGVEVRPKWDIV